MSAEQKSKKFGLIKKKKKDCLVGSAPTYSAALLQATRVRVLARGPFPVLFPSLFSPLLPVSFILIKA